jgi:hypothetical protein
MDLNQSHSFYSPSPTAMVPKKVQSIVKNLNEIKSESRLQNSENKIIEKLKNQRRQRIGGDKDKKNGGPVDLN